jgi:hypothetical protein
MRLSPKSAVTGARAGPRSNGFRVEVGDGDGSGASAGASPAFARAETADGDGTFPRADADDSPESFPAMA